MRTVTFQSVYEAILRRHGIDPLGGAVTYDTARAIAERINERVDTAWKMWDWPTLSVTEQRAFRSVWNNSRQFRIVGENGYPDELYYLGTPPPPPTGPGTPGTGAGYYRVKASAPGNPPIGTAPTNTTYFEQMQTVSHYIEVDQACRHAIGIVHGVYPTDPSTNGCGQRFGLEFRPSEQGIHVYGDPPATVFVWYELAVPTFTMKPYIAGKANALGDRVFYSADGNCYRALAATSGAELPTNASFWALEPMPDLIAVYVKAGAYSDCLRETILDGAPDQATRLQRVAAANEEAEAAIAQEIDVLIAQGQKHYWGAWGRRGCGYYYDYTVNPVIIRGCAPAAARLSAPWGGDVVHYLSELCEDDAEFVAPPAMAQPGMMYADTVVALKAATASPSLDQIVTATLAINTLVQIVISPTFGGTSFQSQEYRLRPGAADPSDPGQVAPLDYDGTYNNVHWERVG